MEKLSAFRINLLICLITAFLSNSCSSASFCTNSSIAQTLSNSFSSEFGSISSSELSFEQSSEFSEAKRRYLDGAIMASFGDSLVAQYKWQPYIEQEFAGSTVLNHGIGSTTIAFIPEREDDYPCLVNQQRISNLLSLNPCVIFLWGGTNDAHLNVPIGTSAEYAKPPKDKDTTTFIGAYSYLIESILLFNNSIQIIIMTTMTSIYYELYDYDLYAEAEIGIADHYSIPYIDTNSKSGITKEDYSTYTSDGLHLNEEGGRIVGTLCNSMLHSLFG